MKESSRAFDQFYLCSSPSCWSFCQCSLLCFIFCPSTLMTTASLLSSIQNLVLDDSSMCWVWVLRFLWSFDYSWRETCSGASSSVCSSVLMLFSWYERLHGWASFVYIAPGLLGFARCQQCSWDISRMSWLWSALGSAVWCLDLILCWDAARSHLGCWPNACASETNRRLCSLDSFQWWAHASLISEAARPRRLSSHQPSW